VRMRPNIRALLETGSETRRPDVIEEDERPDHLVRAVRQNAPDLETTEVAAALVNYSLQHVRTTPGRR
jgi:hypothetical protein